MIQKFSKLLRHFRRREDGSASVEFALLFTPFMVLMASSYEVSLANIRHVYLERGVDLAVREIRLSTGSAPNKEEIRSGVCSIARVIPNCKEVLEIELVPVNMDTWNLPNSVPECIDKNKDFNPLTQYSNGAQNELMLIRFCAVAQKTFPTFGFLSFPRHPADPSAYRLITTTAFVNEPT
ncbi:MAG: TadE/TadG family type IV pilus assembly protein [Pseudomonadota bacterium]